MQSRNAPRPLSLVATLVACATLVDFATPVQAQGAEEPRVAGVPELSGLAARWSAAMKALDVPGFALAVVMDDSVLALDAFGVRNVAGEPATPDTCYYIASATKPYTAMAVCILAGEGKIMYQPNSANRFEGFIAKQRYDKPNRGAGTGNPLAGTQDSDSKELDTFLIAQVSYNRVLSDRMFLDSKLSYNNTHFPLYQKTDLQPITDNSTQVLFRNRQSSQIMFRRRVQAVANWQYFLPEFAGGRHEFKAGFDNGYTPEDVDVTRVNDVNLAFTSLPTPARRP